MKNQKTKKSEKKRKTSPFNAIRNRQTGNVLIRHKIDGQVRYFWLVKTAGDVVSITNTAGYVLRKEDWDYMLDPKRGNGIQTKIQIKKDLMVKYRKAERNHKIETSPQVAKFQKRYGNKRAKRKLGAGAIVRSVRTKTDIETPQTKLAAALKKAMA
ncbi:MAG: hypothetical protein GXP45_01250 [bacterium]|nr:hypothetical protein [bacterium]